MQDILPESISALDFSAAVLESASIWVILHISSNSNLFFITSSFILLAFSLVSLCTSADAFKMVKKILRNYIRNNQIKERKEIECDLGPVQLSPLREHQVL